MFPRRSRFLIDRSFYRRRNSNRIPRYTKRYFLHSAQERLHSIFREGVSPGLLVLDFIITNEEGIVTQLEILPGLSKSYHASVICFLEHKRKIAHKYMYGNVNYNGMMMSTAIKWEEEFHNKSAGGSSNIFQKPLTEAAERYILNWQVMKRAKHGWHPRLRHMSRRNTSFSEDGGKTLQMAEQDRIINEQTTR